MFLGLDDWIKRKKTHTDLFPLEILWQILFLCASSLCSLRVNASLSHCLPCIPWQVSACCAAKRRIPADALISLSFTFLTVAISIRTLNFLGFIFLNKLRGTVGTFLNSSSLVSVLIMNKILQLADSFKQDWRLSTAKWDTKHAA